MNIPPYSNDAPIVEATELDRLRDAAARLAAAGIDESMREARILWRNAADHHAFEAFIARREKREPVAYILGRREFWSLEFAVSPAVLIPRPDSESLIEAALKEFAATPPARIIDLGTGSGCLLITLLTEWPNAAGIGIDASPAALAVARANAARHNLEARANFRAGDWLHGIDEKFDFVISNPPYVSDPAFAALEPDVRDHEPAMALKGGPLGLNALERITHGLRAVLADEGLAIVEIGFDQGPQAHALFTNAGLNVTRIVTDLAGRDRAVVARLPQLPGGEG